ncbi:ribokinase [Variibacter gotjawalensis]|uniref:Ribokinase n=1 Tax=Variibacter gotjawalensis TaxID=1333996 RepID=A0A0S3PPQ4_9BRAD|nr:PfkB family carbohydrate kinase [Variibacter gotjawalensis]NIK48210.1 sugar/nucleoside kinase (ribokinase family) [Variibacter gotjawalensis]RZS50081.1 sulfofructose kinase [Variibacter gotjawalensis]BAT57912.1 ribokinase [Variibacter gotjawalensis]
MSFPEFAAPERARRVLCAGIAVFDHVYQMDAFPPPGSKTRAKNYVAVSGGCAGNAAIALARLGGIAALTAPLGDPDADPVGQQILDYLATQDVDCSLSVRVKGATSPISAIIVDGAGERLIVNHRDERLSAARLADPAKLARETDAILADNRFAEFVLPLCHAAREANKPCVLDGDRPTEASSLLLRACSHLVFAADGLRATAQCDDLGEALHRIARETDSFIAVTDNANGTYWLDDGKVRHMPTYRVNAIDTLGAGDTFHGAFVLALAEGHNEVDAISFSTAAAAIKCERFGGVLGAPHRQEVLDFLAKNS